MPLTQNHELLDNMELSEYRSPTEIHTNKLRYPLIPSLMDHGLLSANLSRKAHCSPNSNAHEKAYGEPIILLGPSNQ